MSGIRHCACPNAAGRSFCLSSRLPRDVGGSRRRKPIRSGGSREVAAATCCRRLDPINAPSSYKQNFVARRSRNYLPRKCSRSASGLAPPRACLPVRLSRLCLDICPLPPKIVIAYSRCGTLPPAWSQAPVGVTTSHQCYGSCTGCQSVSASCSRSRGSCISRLLDWLPRTSQTTIAFCRTLAVAH